MNSPGNTGTTAAGGSEPLLTVIVPVYNESGTIDQLLGRVVATPWPKQVIVVDDGSSDGTSQILDRWADRPGVLVLRHPQNQGKGAAIRTALQRAKGRFVVIQDGDLEYDPNDFGLLLEPLLRGQAQVVYGSRFLGQRGLRSWLSLHRLGITALNLCVRMLYGARLTDEATCYKMFPMAVLQAMDLRCQRFEFCPEATAKACRMGIKILEVPIRYHPRSLGEGKKIRWRDGIEALRTLWRWRRWRPGPAYQETLEPFGPKRPRDLAVATHPDPRCPKNIEP